MDRLQGGNRNEAVGLYVGLAVLVLGIALLLTGFVMAFANLQAAPGIQVSGSSMTDLPDPGSQFGLGQMFAPLADLAVGAASITAAFFMLRILWLIGASITTAGWNPIRPRPETVRVRIKPKHLEAEPVDPAADTAPVGASTPEAPSTVPSSEAPPPPPA